MVSPLIIWSIVVAAIIVLFAISIVSLLSKQRRIYRRKRRLHHRRRVGALSYGTEAEELFVPGDAVYDSATDD